MEYTQLIDGGLTDDDMTMLPIYFGVGDEANQDSAQVQKITGA